MREEQRSAILADLMGFQEEIAVIANSILNLQDKTEDLMSKILSYEEKIELKTAESEEYVRRSVRRRDSRSRSVARS